MPILSIARTVLGSLFKKPYTTKFPFEPIVYPEGIRGHLENDIEKCVFCSLCQKVCPTNAIEVRRAEGYWSLEKRRCILCQTCVDRCPKKCMNMLNSPSDPLFEGQTKIEMKGTPPPPPAKKAENA